MFNHCTYFEIGPFFIVSVVDKFDLKMNPGHFDPLCSRALVLYWKVKKTAGVIIANDLYKKPAGVREPGACRNCFFKTLKQL